MEHLLFFAILVILVYFLVKVSRLIWRILNTLLFVFFLWYFRETILGYIDHFAQVIPNPTISHFMTDWVNWLRERIELIQNLIH